MKITKDTIIHDILNTKLSTSLIFMRFGMGCSTCPHSREETLETGAKLHNVDVEQLIYELEKHINK